MILTYIDYGQGVHQIIFLGRIRIDYDTAGRKCTIVNNPSELERQVEMYSLRRESVYRMVRNRGKIVMVEKGRAMSLAKPFEEIVENRGKIEVDLGLVANYINEIFDALEIKREK